MQRGLTTHLLYHVYRTGESKWKKFLDEFSTYLESLATRPYPVVIKRDFNIHLEREKDLRTVQFLDILQINNFKQHIDKPTHRLRGILDLVITRQNDTDTENNLTEINIFPCDAHQIGKSDHYFIKYNMDFQANRTTTKPRLINYRNTTDMDINKVKCNI